LSASPGRQSASIRCPSKSSVVRGGSDSDYVEILVTIDRCPTDPYRFSLGVFRNAPEAVVRQEIATLLKRHVEDQH
jgi:hypothetical protein